MARNTEGNNQYGNTPSVPTLKAKSEKIAGTLAAEKHEFFQKEQKVREEIGRETIGSLTNQTAEVVARDTKSNIRVRTLVGGKLVATDAIQPGETVTLLGKYMITRQGNINYGQLKVRLRDGSEGYIAADHLAVQQGKKPVPPATAEALNNDVESQKTSFESTLDALKIAPKERAKILEFVKKNPITRLTNDGQIIDFTSCQFDGKNITVPGIGKVEIYDIKMIGPSIIIYTPDRDFVFLSDSPKQ